jgi:RHS repeat-associated protein
MTSSGLDERLYSIHDANFNVTAVVDIGGAVVERYQYDPYGNFAVLDANFGADSDSISDIDWKHLYQGAPYESMTELYSFRNRDYSAQLGRWTQVDPVGYLDSMSLYQVVLSNPVALNDPLGLCACLSAPTTQPAGPTTKPASPTTQLAGPTTQPAGPTTRPLISPPSRAQMIARLAKSTPSFLAPTTAPTTYAPFRETEPYKSRLNEPAFALCVAAQEKALQGTPVQDALFRAELEHQRSLLTPIAGAQGTASGFRRDPAQVARAQSPLRNLRAAQEAYDKALKALVDKCCGIQ